MFAKFITVDYVLANSTIDKDVDADLVNQFIDESQDINIQELLGYSLYTKIMTDISTTGTTTGAYYDLLTQHIQPTQTKWLVYHLLPFLNYHLTNKSVSEKSSEYSKPTELANLQYIRSIAQSKAEFYGARLKEYIKNNLSSFPEYYSINGFDRIRPKSTNYYGGMYLPNTAEQSASRTRNNRN